MTNRVERPAKEFQSLCAQLGYRKRKVIIVSTTSIVLSNLNWSGGSRSTYHSFDIKSGDVITHSQLSRPHPMDNNAEGARIAMVEGICIVETGVFQGKDMTMRIYVHPLNMPKVLA